MEEDDDVDYQEEYRGDLPCGVCEHDLNHECYNVLPHPQLPKIPLCILCYEQVVEADSQESCAWCGEEGMLYECASDVCGRSFCVDCLRSNLDSAAVEEIEKDDDWRCLVCDWDQGGGQDFPRLKQHETALELAKGISMYLKYPSSSSASSSAEDVEFLTGAGKGKAEGGGEEEGEGEEGDALARVELINKNLSYLTPIVSSLRQVEEALTRESLAARRGEIKEELRVEAFRRISMRRSNNSSSPGSVSMGNIDKQADEELAIFEAKWKRHYDILQRQESICHRIIESFELDPFSHSSYTQPHGMGGPSLQDLREGKGVPPAPTDVIFPEQEQQQDHDWWDELPEYEGRMSPSLHLAAEQERAGRLSLIHI